MFEVILIANAIWFALAFHLFSFRSRVFAKIVVPEANRDTPVFDVLVATGPFLGGFNLAFALLSVLLVFNTDVFADDLQRVILLTVFAVAHGSQFFGNLPIAWANRSGGGVWQVSGLMGFIFITDCLMMIGNAALAVVLA